MALGHRLTEQSGKVSRVKALQTLGRWLFSSSAPRISLSLSPASKLLASRKGLFFFVSGKKRKGE